MTIRHIHEYYYLFSTHIFSCRRSAIVMKLLDRSIVHTERRPGSEVRVSRGNDFMYWCRIFKWRSTKFVDVWCCNAASINVVYNTELVVRY